MLLTQIVGEYMIRAETRAAAAAELTLREYRAHAALAAVIREELSEHRLEDAWTQIATAQAELDLGRRLGFGVRVRPSRLIRLSQLGERTAGTGATRTTVIHLQLREPWRHGRLIRHADDQLCGTTGRWAVAREALTASVTCAQCLAMLSRLTGRAAAPAPIG